MKKVSTLLLLTLILPIFAHNSHCQETVRIASKKSIDQVVLGKALVLYLRNNSINAVDMTDYGEGPELRKALLQGQIDIYFEELSTAWFNYFGGKGIHNDPYYLYQRCKDRDIMRRIYWLPYAPANRTFAIVMKKQMAIELHIYTVSDLLEYLGKHPGKVKLLIPKELKQARDLVNGMIWHYRKIMNMRRKIVLKTISINHSLISDVVGSGGLYAGLTLTTLGSIIENNLICLDDNLYYFPSYNIAPVVREDVLTEHPRLLFLLNLFVRKITTSALRRFNYAVLFKGKSLKDSATEWVTRHFQCKRKMGYVR